MNYILSGSSSISKVNIVFSFITTIFAEGHRHQKPHHDQSKQGNDLTL